MPRFKVTFERRAPGAQRWQRGYATVTRESPEAAIASVQQTHQNKGRRAGIEYRNYNVQPAEVGAGNVRT